MCTKNPGHASFIPINEFSIHHLPENYRDADIVEWIKAAGDMTVQLRCKHISIDRPNTFPDTEKGRDIPGYEDSVGTPYPFSQYWGRDVMFTGTGWVVGVNRYTGRCRCKQGCPYTGGAKVFIKTARHVIYDSSEAVKTKIIFFYDSEEEVLQVPQVWGNGVRDSNTEEDWSQVWFISHDASLLDRLEGAMRQWEDLKEKLEDRYISPSPYPETRARFPVIVTSHPHGCSKIVTQGKSSDLQTGLTRTSAQSTVHFYDTPTCPGCGGAPVWSLWGKMLSTGAHVHCAALRNGIQKSGVGSWF